MRNERNYRLVRYRRHLIWRRYVRVLQVLFTLYVVAVFVLPFEPREHPIAWYALILVAGALVIAAVVGLVVYALTRAPLPPKWQKRATAA